MPDLYEVVVERHQSETMLIVADSAHEAENVAKETSRSEPQWDTSDLDASAYVRKETPNADDPVFFEPEGWTAWSKVKDKVFS